MFLCTRFHFPFVAASSAKSVYWCKIEGVDIDVLVCGGRGVKEDAFNRLGDVREDGKLAGDSAVVVDCGGAGGEIEA